MNSSILIIVIVVVGVYLYMQKSKDDKEYLSGMWYNQKEKMYVYISDEANEDGSRGGYIVQDDTTSDKFTIKVEDSLLGNASVASVSGTDALPSESTLVIDMVNGKITFVHDISETVLYKDNSISETLKSQ